MLPAGYLVDPDHVSRHALDLGSPEFAAVLRRLEPITPTVVVGVIETERGRYFNTAAVITGGRLVGRYAKPG
jgi:predicted amidohydrolase